MKQEDFDRFMDFVSEQMKESKFVKIGTIVVVSVAGIYLLGHLFHILAHTRRGYNNFVNAMSGQ